MIANNISPCITTEKVQESKDFYIRYLGAKVIFDCGWYVNLQFGKDSSELQFMSPRQPGQPICDCEGLTYNFLVSDVDEEYSKLVDEGLNVIMPLEDHPWGDRGFAIQDPNGIMLYIYSIREPNEEFKKYYK